MSTLSVPISPDLEMFIARMIRDGVASNKADVVRKALKKYAEDQAVEEVLLAEQEANDGKILRGDLKDLVKKMP